MSTEAQTLQPLDYAAQRLGISYQRAAQLARDGVLPVVRLGRKVKVDPMQLERYISEGGKALPGGW